MKFRRIVPTFALGLLLALIAGRVDTDLAAEETKLEKRKAFLKKMLEKKNKPQTDAAPGSDAKPYDPGSPPPRPKFMATAALAALVDAGIDGKLEAAKVAPSVRTDDAEFLRRAFLDIAGVIPTPDRVVRFLDSTEKDKRAKLIEELIAHPGFGRRMADVYGHLLFPVDSDNRFVRKEPLTKWLAESFNKGDTWNAIVTELMTAVGTQEDRPATTYTMANRGVDKLTDSCTKVFLGIQMQCAQCHNHPFAEWKQKEYWGMSQFYMKVSTGNPKAALKGGAAAEVKEIDSPNRKQNPLPEAAKPTTPKFLGGDEVKLPTNGSWRSVLAEWTTSRDNPYFAKSMTNRIWSLYFGRGIVNPVDDMLEDRPNTHPELLMALSKEFAASGFDIKHMVRGICNSEAYQRSSKPTSANKADVALWSHQAMKVLTPEQLFDSLATSSKFDDMPAPKGKIAGQPKGPPQSPRDRFVLFFQSSEDAKATEYETGIPQTLRLMNAARLTASPVVLAEINKAGLSREKAIERLYLGTVSRRPTADEVKKMLEYADKQSDLKTAYGDILWALTNSSEFAMNR